MTRDEPEDLRDAPEDLEEHPEHDHAPDGEPPPAGTFMRRLSAGTSGAAGAFSLAEEVFAPTLFHSRAELERQRRIGRPAPAPADPPNLEPADEDPSHRFRGRIVVRRPAHPPEPDAQAGQR